MADAVMRLGIPDTGRLLSTAARRHPLMISAMRLWNGRGFRSLELPEGVDIALDSGGYSAWRHHGGYPFTPEQLCELAESYPWSFVVTMDRPGDPAWTRRAWRDLVRIGADVTPCLHGLDADDYACDAQQYDDDLLCVGGLVRREADDVVAIVRAILAVTHADLHLLGVKSSAWRRLRDHPQVIGADSMAWDFDARMEARRNGHPSTVDHRLQWMDRWAERQNAPRSPDPLTECATR